jgi:hypothetical protein
MDEVHSAIEE